MNRDLYLVDGHAFSWRRLCELRRQQLAALKQAEGLQPPLFELRHDARPAGERSAARRYEEPSLFAFFCSRTANGTASEAGPKNVNRSDGSVQAVPHSSFPPQGRRQLVVRCHLQARWSVAQRSCSSKRQRIMSTLGMRPLDEPLMRWRRRMKAVQPKDNHLRS